MSQFKLTDKQKDARKIMGGEASHVQLEGGSRSGKTFLFLRAIAIRALRSPGSRHAVLRFRFNHVKQSIVFDTWPKMLALCFPNTKCHLNKSDWFAQFDNGSQVWFGGLDDSDKVLGNEYVTIFLNETSQISWEGRNLAMTRLAQKCFINDKDGKLTDTILPLRMFYDLNPGMDTHWSAWLFKKKRDPITKAVLKHPERYASMRINPVDNLENLPDSYMDTLAELPARQRKRFLSGEYADSSEDAYFDSATFDKWRDMSADVDMQRIVVAVDPSGADDENSGADPIGIVVAGIGTDGRGYLLEDLTLRAGPAVWGKVAVEAYHRHMGDMIVGETNYGGGMVEFVIQSTRDDGDSRLPFTKVTATRGKVVRSEPISALVEKGKIRHIGNFPELEDELCGFGPDGYKGPASPNRADAYVWAFSYLFPGLTKVARKEVKKKARVPAMLTQNSGWMGA